MADPTYRGTADAMKNETEKHDVDLDIPHAKNNNTTQEQQRILDIAKRTLPTQYTTGYRNIMRESQLAGIVGSSFLAMTNNIGDDHSGVCKAIESKLNHIVEKINVCPWNYTCTYNHNRYPHYLLQANCRYSQHIPSCKDDKPPQLKTCIPITAMFSVLMATEESGNGKGSTEGSADDVTGDFETTSFRCGESDSLCQEKKIEIAVGCTESTGY